MATYPYPYNGATSDDWDITIPASNVTNPYTGAMGAVSQPTTQQPTYSTQPVYPTSTQQPTYSTQPVYPTSTQQPQYSTQPVYPQSQPTWYTGATPGQWNYTVPQPTYQSGGSLNNPNVGAQNPIGYTNTGEWWQNQQNQYAMNSWLPYAQYEQNRFQYVQDYNEAQRRWDAENAWRQQQDSYNMNLAGRQQTMAEWQASQAANQWAQQFGYQQQQDAWSQQFAQGQQNWLQQYQGGQLANEQAQTAAQNAYWQGQLGQSANELAWQQQYQTGQLGLQGQELASQDWYRRQQADLAQQELTQQGGLQNRELDIRDWYQRQQADIARGQLSVDAMYRSGQIDAQQREIALAELTQQQTNALAQAQFGWQQQYAQLQLAQEAQLSRERMENERRVMAMQAYGRQYAPNVRAVRSWV
jgi:hypothetical protein